ncbi:FliH/SctL family protein, partial [Amnimonas aquatica]|uniref:FliH/SctL family protein n=1 Tax=Amnimonas aquatica TaxID=2094561 RepID=UPI0019D31B16
LLALALARQVIHAELRTTPELVLPVIRQALAELPSASRKVRLHLHPEDAHLIGEGLPELHEASWQVIEDDGISRGGCLLESGSASIDATLETRIAEVVARLGAAAFDAPAAEPQA